MGLFLDFATNLVIWGIVSVVVALVVARLRKSDDRRQYVRIAIIVAVGLAVLATIPSLLKSAEQPVGAQSSSDRGAASDPFGRLSEADQGRLKTIMGSVVRDSTYLTPEVHAEFWTILDRARLSEAEEQNIHDKLAGVAVTYQRLFYSDALAALKSGRPVKSTERRKLEERLLTTGELSQQRLSTNDNLIASIGSGKPVPYQGASVLFDEELIRSVLTSLQTCEKRLAVLFTRSGAAK